PMKNPSDAIIAVTYRCNARCSMCNVWKSTAVDALRPEHLRKLPRSLKTVNLTGGEPFLRDDLPDFVAETTRRCPAAQITISTNGFLVDRIEATLEEIRAIDPTIRLALSLDGPAEVHDRIRGGENFYANAIDLAERLLAGGFKGLRLSMTICRENLDQLSYMADLADRLGVELGIVAAQNADTQLDIDDIEFGALPAGVGRAFEVVIAGWLRSWQPRQWLRGHFAARTYRYLRSERWANRCRPGEDFFFLQADGEVYSSSVSGQAMGNLATMDWLEIWTGPAAVEARALARKNPDTSWMICTARRFYRTRLPGVLTWIAWQKFLAHLGRFKIDGNITSQGHSDANTPD
ncbi:MAG: radical SAM protein, partial [Phycisphaerae bacterium]|nr:radical SAM protein [Phycisphaerae bacterium]